MNNVDIEGITCGRLGCLLELYIKAKVVVENMVATNIKNTNKKGVIYLLDNELTLNNVKINEIESETSPSCGYIMTSNFKMVNTIFSGFN